MSAQDYINLWYTGLDVSDTVVFNWLLYALPLAIILRLLAVGMQIGRERS